MILACLLLWECFLKSKMWKENFSGRVWNSYSDHLWGCGLNIYSDFRKWFWCTCRYDKYCWLALFHHCFNTHVFNNWTHFHKLSDHYELPIPVLLPIFLLSCSTYFIDFCFTFILTMLTYSIWSENVFNFFALLMYYGDALWNNVFKYLVINTSFIGLFSFLWTDNFETMKSH